MSALDAIVARGIALATIRRYNIVATTCGSRACVRFPVRLPNGTVVGARVKYTDGRRPKAGWCAVTPGPLATKALYGADVAPIGLETLLWVEGEPDVWVLHTAGIPAVSLLCGAGSSLSDHTLHALSYLHPRAIYVIYDHDSGGRRGMTQTIHELCRRGWPVHGFLLPAVVEEQGDLTDLWRLVGFDGACSRVAIHDLEELSVPPQAQARRAGHIRFPVRSQQAYAAFKDTHQLADMAATFTDLQPQGGGQILRGRCPLPTYADETPSFTVYQDGHAHCYGCGFHGDVIDLLQAVEQS